MKQTALERAVPLLLALQSCAVVTAVATVLYLCLLPYRLSSAQEAMRARAGSLLGYVLILALLPAVAAFFIMIRRRCHSHRLWFWAIASTICLILLLLVSLVIPEVHTVSQVTPFHALP